MGRSMPSVHFPHKTRRTCHSGNGRCHLSQSGRGAAGSRLPGYRNMHGAHACALCMADAISCRNGANTSTYQALGAMPRHPRAASRPPPPGLSFPARTCMLEPAATRRDGFRRARAPHNAHTARMQHALSGPGDRYREQCIPRPQDGPGRRPDGRRQSCRQPPGRGQAPGRDAAGGRRPQGRIRGVPRTGADHVLSALLDGRRRGGRAFLREIHAQRRRAAAVRHGPGTGRGLLPGLCRTHPRRPPVQQRHPGRP